ncbi:MAG: hypothetical protein ACI906_000159 [Candidatus Latescibacterota bacterium]|jgi:hypothetical protein
MHAIHKILLLLLVLPLVSSAQGKDLRTKEQRLYQIQLRQAQWKVDAAKLEMETRLSDYEETRDLFQQNIRTLDELNSYQRAYQKTKLSYDQAAIALEQTRLSFLRDATHLSIVEARKYRTAEGYRKVEIVLENGSNLSQAMSLNPDKTRAEVSALLELRNINVSLESGSQKMVVGIPYEMPIESLALGQRLVLVFRLLRDEDEVVVVLKTLAGQRDDFHIVLRKDSLQDTPTINSAQFSQEGDLNSRVRYDLILERLAEDEKTFRLAVLNLPDEINYSFIEKNSNANLSQVKFSEETSQQHLELELQIPEKLSRRFVDQIIEFYVFVTDADGYRRIEQFNGRDAAISKEDLASLKGNVERFELIPRGRGALEMTIATRYWEVSSNESVSVRIELLNMGTLAVEDIHLVLTPPLDWTYSTTPELIERIPSGEKLAVTALLIPPAEQKVGEYDVRVEAIGFCDGEKVEASEKELTIRVTASAHLGQNILILVGVFALIIGVAIVSIKASRR